MTVTVRPTRRPGSWRILRAAPACGGRYAWARVRPSGALEMQGCVCHHPFTLALRASSTARERLMTETIRDELQSLAREQGWQVRDLAASPRRWQWNARRDLEEVVVVHHPDGSMFTGQVDRNDGDGSILLTTIDDVKAALTEPPDSWGRRPPGAA